MIATIAAVLLLAVLPAALGADTSGRTPGTERPASGRFERPDPETIRADVQEILSDRRFAPRWSFWEWLREKLGSLRLPAFGGSGVGVVLIWIILIWCVLTLLAILGHFVWTVVTLVSGRRGRYHPGRALGEEAEDASYEELRRRASELAQAGRHREAIGVMMMMMLRWLDQAGRVRFHQSKTNGDYVREYPAGRAGRQEFDRFALDFDVTFYGGAPCGAGDYDRMESQFEQVLKHVQEE